MPVRSFHDAEGREWSVWSVTPSRKSDLFLPQTMADGWLCFECGDEKRRLHPVSDDWDALDESALLALCMTAVPVARRPERRPPPLDPEPLPATPAAAE
ncbi:MAG TPA: hypothetical protein VEY93_06195 [Longimicrobium sp.]|nr:hypothetical protein [Longimicrobium sp.]